MRLASAIISLCLHTGVFLIIWFWPAPAPFKLDAPPIMISLVEGEPGGNKTPSPILGPMGESSDGPQAPAPPAPQSEVAAPAREEIIPPRQGPSPLKAQEQAVEVPKKPEAIPLPEKKPEPPKEEVKVPETPKPEEKKVEKAKEQIKKPEPKKPEAEKSESKKPEVKKTEPKKPEPKKPETRKTPPKKAPQDPVAAALQKARQATSRTASGDKGNAVEQALAQARRNAGGNRGGGGGEGEGPGGGGLGDVYIGQVMTAVRPNWGFTAGGRRSLLCIVRVTVDMQGNVLEAVISQSSGNAQYDASAVNAIIRTSKAGNFPPPPNPEYGNLDVRFTLDELMGR